MKLPPHPIQPLFEDENGTIRFRPNAIVRHLLDNGGIDMNELASLSFSSKDREQFAQLIGYSHSGAGDLSYMSNEVHSAAWEAYENGKTTEAARANYLSQQVKELKDALRPIVSELFNIHKEDLN